MDRDGSFYKFFGSELLVSPTVMATSLGEVAVWGLQESTMIGANDGDDRIVVYILNL